MVEYTPSEAQSFFQQVKGKKIRWATWSKDVYFIPTKLMANGLDMTGTLIEKDKVRSSEDEIQFYINRGFEATDNKGEFCWHLVDEESPVKSTKCECGASKINSSHHYDWCPQYKE